MAKWIGAVLGYIYFRFSGAILGYFLGSLIDRFFGGTSRQTFSVNYSRSMNSDQFELNLLALASIVIKADNRIHKGELDFVRNYFITNYGAEYASIIFSKFNTEVKKDNQNLAEITQLFVNKAQYNTRLQIIHFLFGISKADGSILPNEIRKIHEIANLLKIRSIDFESVKAMFVEQAGNAYKILEIDSSATDAEVKKAYRAMAKKYHPDKLNLADAALRKGAKEKFQKVQAAYEKIQKERGL